MTHISNFVNDNFFNNMSGIIFDSSVLSLPATPNLSNLNSSEIKKVFQNIETIILDCDGVLWVDETPIPHAVEVIYKLRAMDIKILLYTNNSIKTKQEFMSKITDLGFIFEDTDVITMATGLIAYLKGELFSQRIYLIGSRGLAEDLEKAGYEHLGIEADILQHSVAQTVENFYPDSSVGAVVVGYDEHFCYTKMLKAASYLNNPNCLFLVTTKDERCLLNQGIVVPGTGAILAAIETASQRKAIPLGKPYSTLLDILIKEKGINPKKTMIIGDTINTDIFFGNRSGFVTVLVLTGATGDNIFDRKKGGKKMYREYMPDFFIPSLGDLLNLL